MTQQFKLVPIEPTDEMIKAWKKYDVESPNIVPYETSIAGYYKAMLTAAPDVAGEAVACEPIYYSNDDGDSWYDSPDDIDFIDALDPPEIGAEYELHVAYKNAIRTYKVTKVPDEISDDYEVELVSHRGPIYYTTPQPDRTVELQEQVLQLQDNVKRLVEALRGANELFHSIYGANLPPPIEVIRVAQRLEEIGGGR